MDYLTPFLIALVIFFIILWVGFQWYKKNKEYNEKIKENLDDEHIIDPKTGTKITLEQAENGYWEEPEDKLGIMSENDIQKLYTEEEKETERTLNYLKENFLKLEVDNDTWLTLWQTKIVNQYDNFQHHIPFKAQNSNGTFFLALVELGSNTDIPYRIGSYYLENQIMLWLTVDFDLGHYYFREKTSAEKIMDKVRNNNDFNLTTYETFTFKKTQNIHRVEQILKVIEQEKGFEIEFMGSNIFIKNLRHANLEDLHKIEKIVETIVDRG